MVDYSKMEPRRAVTTAQVAALVGYMEEHGDLVLGKDRTVGGRALSRRLWDECAAAVNRQGEPRNGRDWAKYWCELKCRVKAKMVGGAIPLTALEERVAVFVRQSTSDNSNPEKESVPKEEEPEPELEEENAPPTQSPVPPTLPPAQPSPKLSSSPRSSASRCRPRAMASRATQYSPSTLISSLLARSEERHARIEERRARMEERRTHLEERRAHTEQLLAEAVMQRTEAAVVQAEAARTQAQALTDISQALQQFVEVASNFLMQPNSD